MAQYYPPISEIKFALECVAGQTVWTEYDRFLEAGEDLVLPVLEEAGKLAGDIIAPTNKIGDEIGTRLMDGSVVTPDVFKAMHKAYIEGGWTSLPFDEKYGGQGLPGALSIAVAEMVTSANLAYSLNGLLSSGAIEAIHAHASNAQKNLYLPKLISGEWSATMNLTEPGAGSDVGALKTRAVPDGDGSYLISGQKIFITWGDHDLADNIIHLVLARLPGAPKGTRGISMFLVPKYHVSPEGALTVRNDVSCVSLEHKLGIHASPTCVMSFGDKGQCKGYLVGQENKGMSGMFTMMNHARLGVGLQGVALGERAFQDAAEYASERVQGALIGSENREAVPIIQHPDVQRMLMTIKANVEACRALVYRNAWALDRAEAENDEVARKKAQGEADLLTPISKAFATDIGVEATSEAIQVFGGMGFIEETGVAQHYRDVRIAPIYEGTNGIQAMDLIGRKLQMDGGRHWRDLISEMQAFTDGMPDDISSLKKDLLGGVSILSQASEHMFELGQRDIQSAAAVSAPYLRLFGTVLGAYLLCIEASEAERRIKNSEGDPVFMGTKLKTARFYIEHLLPLGTARLSSVLAAGEAITSLKAEDFKRS